MIPSQKRQQAYVNTPTAITTNSGYPKLLLPTRMKAPCTPGAYNHTVQDSSTLLHDKQQLCPSITDMRSSTQMSTTCFSMVRKGEQKQMPHAQCACRHQWICQTTDAVQWCHEQLHCSKWSVQSYYYGEQHETADKAEVSSMYIN